MYQYRMSIFLLCEDSAIRLISKLAMTGTTIKSCLMSGKLLLETVGVSAVFTADCENKVKTSTEYGEQVVSILKYLEIPYFGICLRGIQNGDGWLDSGWFPPLKTESLSLPEPKINS